MKHLMQITLTAMLLAGFVAAPASASSRKKVHSWDNLKKIKIGEEVQVQHGFNQYLNGRFQGYTSQGITVQWGRVNLHDETIARADVQRVITWRDGQRFKNVLKGIGWGALGGGAILLMAASARASDGADTPVEAAPIAVGAGMIIGGIAGGVQAPEVEIYRAESYIEEKVSRRPVRAIRSAPASSGSRRVHCKRDQEETASDRDFEPNPIYRAASRVKAKDNRGAVDAIPAEPAPVDTEGVDQREIQEDTEPNPDSGPSAADDTPAEPTPAEATPDVTEGGNQEEGQEGIVS